MPTRDVLLRAKCRALVRSRWPEVVDAPDATQHDLPSGSALRSGTTAWFLAEDDPERSLGGALVWSRRHGADTLHLLATGAAGHLARRARHFPGVTVWRIDGTVLHEAEPEPRPVHPPADPRTEPFRALFDRAGATPVDEGGVLRAEVRGLEVARVEIDEASGEPVLRIGVGKHDREAQREIRGDRQGFDELFEVVRIVAEHRTADGLGHAAFLLSAERWLRDVVIRDPRLAGTDDELVAVPSPARRDDLRAPAPAPAAAVHEPLLVVCSVGTDLDLVPAATDAYEADGRRPHLRFVVPEGDDLPSTRELVELVDLPADLVTVPANWRS